MPARATPARRAARRAAARNEARHTGHDPDRSALIVEIPEAEALVGPWRLQHDPVASAGVPAHVTVLYPFDPPDELDDATLRNVAGIASAVTPFRVAFTEPATWPGIVWLRPAPDDELRALTREAVARFPEHPPYDGAYPDTVPHLTVGQSLDDDQMHELLEAMRRGLADGPIVSEVRSLSLWASDDAGKWRRWHAWTLGHAAGL